MSLSAPRMYADRYEIHAPVGMGTFSLTYRATDTLLQRNVAIKVLRREYANNDTYAARFDREAQAAARIHHPNVVPIFDFGRQADVPFIVMQYVDGPTLKEFVREQGPLTIEEAVSFTRQILAGLSAIHEQGIIHRDVKPQNVLLDEEMIAKVTDFGVAFIAHDPGLTDAGMTVGTAAYMAPEQASGESVGPQTDIYAAGVILYELLTGRLPFVGDNPVQVMYRHVSEVPDLPRQYNRYIPVELEAIVLKALAKMPADRYPSALAMRDALSGRTAVSAAASSRAMAETIQSRPVSVTGQAATPPPRSPGRAARRSGDRSWMSLLLIVFTLALIISAAIFVATNGIGFNTAADDSGEAQDVPGFAGSDATPTATNTDSGEATAADATPTTEAEESQPTAAATDGEGGVRTATPIPPATPTPPPAEPTATPDQPAPEPTATNPPSPEPTAPGEPTDATFNTPFPGRAVPGQWSQGLSVTFGRDDFVAGGAYRRPDGVLYERPAAHLYGENTDYPATTVRFEVLERPTTYIGIVVTGMDDELDGHVQCRLLLNGHVVWEGESPFANEGWTDIGWLVGSLDWLDSGDNTLTIEVLSGGGEFGRPPWILLNQAKVYYG